MSNSQQKCFSHVADVDVVKGGLWIKTNKKPKQTVFTFTHTKITCVYP